jgi:hypothetical protein
VLRDRPIGNIAGARSTTGGVRRGRVGVLVDAGGPALPAQRALRYIHS